MRNVEMWVFDYLLNSLWQAPLLLAGGWGAARLLRVWGARAEHRVWVIALLLQAFLPAASLLPWSSAWITSFWTRSAFPGGEVHVQVLVGGGVAGTGITVLPAVLLGVDLIYALGLLVLTLRFLWRLRSLSLVRRDALRRPAANEEAWLGHASGMALEEGSVYLSERIFSPLTVGFVRKLLLLPVQIEAALSPTEMRAVIAHECAHMQRNDYLKNLVYEWLSLPVSFHPCVAIAKRQVMETREMVCDQSAAGTGPRNAYVQSLLRVASLLVGTPPANTPHALGIYSANSLERRLMRLKRTPLQAGMGRRAGSLVVCAALGLGTCAAALALGMRGEEVRASEHSKGGTAAPVSVSAATMAGNRLEGPPPKYPVDAKKAHIQGKVVLHAVIGKTGKVENLKIVSGPKELQQSSLDAVQHWIYKPFLLNGSPVAVTTTVNVTYSLVE